MISRPARQRSTCVRPASWTPATVVNAVAPHLPGFGGDFQMCRQINAIAGPTQYDRLPEKQPFISEFAYCVARQEYPNCMSDL